MEDNRSNMDILKEVEEKRGYLLPYHELFWCLDPVLLERYDQFYENLTLKTRFLDNKTKELVWLGILISVFEEAGTIHLKRARDAGVTDGEISDVIVLSQVAKGFEVLLFIEEKWGKYLPNINIMATYSDLIKNLSKNFKLPENIVELVFIGIYSALPIKKALRYHLVRAKECGLRDEEIAEAMSYIFIPRGGNVLIQAAEVLKDVVKNGELKADSVLKYWALGNK